MMDLPSDIESEIVNYLNLEYGAYESNVLKPSDLLYEGEFVVDGKKIKYWKYPCAEKEGCWATVEPYEEGYLIGMTTSSPK